MQANILRAELLRLINISSSSLSREIKENGFPKPEKVGNAHYFPIVPVYEHLTELAGRPVSIGDKLNSSKQLAQRFNKSPTWVWLHFLKNKERKAKAVYLRSRPFWLESDIQSDSELVKYLEVVKEVSA